MFKNVKKIASICISIFFIYSCSQSSEIKKHPGQTDNNWNDSLVTELNNILVRDQQFRSSISIKDKQSQSLNDYYNLIKVEAILNKFGWPGPEIVGQRGNDAMFLVIQHADISIQRKYLPMVRQAVIDRKLSGKTWIILEDRVSLANTGLQIYGSQIEMNQITGEYYISPIMDEKNVNKRREKLGLEKLEKYVSFWGIKYALPKD